MCRVKILEQNPCLLAKYLDKINIYGEYLQMHAIFLDSSQLILSQTLYLGNGIQLEKIIEFKGTTLIDIRKYWINGKKPRVGGISLNYGQYLKLKTLIPEINQKLKRAEKVKKAKTKSKKANDKKKPKNDSTSLKDLLEAICGMFYLILIFEVKKIICTTVCFTHRFFRC